MSGYVHESMEPAVEVATLLGETVVGVKHCIDPRGGKVRPRTWLMIGGGAAALVMSAVAFAVSVATAAANQRALAAWLAAHRPAFAFRAEQLGPGWDVMAFGGLAVGIAVLALAIVRVRDERRSPAFRIGTAPGVDQAVEGAPAASFALVAPAGDDFAFQFGAGMDGELAVGGQAASLAELVASGRARPASDVAGAFALVIPPQARIRARVGRTTFLVAAVGRPGRQAAASWVADGRLLRYFAGSLAAHVAILLLLQLVSTEAGAASIDLAAVEATPTAGSHTEQEDVTPPPETGNDGDGGGAGAAAQAMKLEEGSAGARTGARDGARLQIARRNDSDPRLAREQAIEEARTAGVMGDAALTGAIASVASDADTANGFDTRDVMGPIFGPDGGPPGYGFGVGRRGFGPGGGNGDGLVPGSYGVICGAGHDCIGAGTSGRWGTGGPGLRRHQGAVPRVVDIGKPVADDGIDKSIIRRYIKRNLEKIAYCYEHELLARPNLEGSISVRFFIQPDGSVSNAAGTGFDGTVASCVARVVSSIEFPRPGSGAGGVEVNYPFTFHPTGH